MQTRRRVLSTLALPVERLGSQWRVSTLCRLAATRLPVDTAGRVDALAGTVRARARELAAELDATGGRPDAAIRARLSGTESLARDLGLTAEVLRYRHDLIEELS